MTFSIRRLTKPAKRGLIGLGLLLGAASAQATIVELQTSLGTIRVNLFDHDANTKATVDNFLKYVEGAEGYGSYRDTIIHRSAKNFVIQGGGYEYRDDKTPPLQAIISGPSIKNQPVYSNVRGTIAMAKLSSGPNTATNQWFFNLSDNNANNLDTQNSGFTVFGQVVAGMDVVDAIAAVGVCNLGSPIDQLPLRSVTCQELVNDKNYVLDDRHFVIINDVVVVNSDTNSAAALNPVKNTRIHEKGSSSGSTSWILLGLMAGLLGFRRR